MIDFTRPTSEVLRHIRAFGTSESLAKINGTWLVVTRAFGWVEPHNIQPGTVVHVYNASIIVSTPDSYVALTDNSLASPELVERLPQ